MSNRKKSIFMQAGILAMAGIIVRIIGLLYRSPLTAIIGDEGNGYYGYAYNCYSIALLISSYSIPSALSKLIAGKIATGEYENAQRYFRGALRYVIVVGGAVSLVVFIFAPFFVTDKNAAPVLRIFAPTIFLFGILGVFRGYFQAHRTMTPTSVSQILEQLANAFISVFAALFFTKIAESFDSVSPAVTGLEMLMTGGVVTDRSATSRAVWGASGSALGTGAGVLVALLFMVLMYSANKAYVNERIFLDMHRRMSMKKVMRNIVLCVTPFIFGTLIYNVTKLLDQTVFTNVMIYGKEISESAVATEYGIFSGKALVLSEIPIAIASALSSAMIPEIASNAARGKDKAVRALSSKVIYVTVLVAVPAAFGLGVLAKPLTMLLFPQRATLDRAAGMLAVLSLSVVFYALSTLTNAILQGVGRVWTPAVNSGIAVVIQAIVLYVILSNTDLYAYAIAIAFVIHSVLLTLLNHIFIVKYRLAKLDYVKLFLGPVVSSLIMAAAAFTVYHVINFFFGLFLPGEYAANLIAVVPAIAIAVYVYAFVMIRLNFISEDEISDLPGGVRLKSLLVKLKITYTAGAYPGNRGKNRRKTGSRTYKTLKKRRR